MVLHHSTSLTYCHQTLQNEHLGHHHQVYPCVCQEMQNITDTTIIIPVNWTQDMGILARDSSGMYVLLI